MVMISLTEILLLTEAAPQDSVLIGAVKEKKIIALYYKGDRENSPGWRTGIIPVCFGTTAGKKYLRVWQTTGKTTTQIPGWKLLRVDRISNINVLSKKTADKVPDSRFNSSGDKQIQNILAIAKF
jgi:predicted DNA-binding transcriptional regulator YafY